MTIEMNISAQSLDAWEIGMEEMIEDVKPKVQSAMGQRFYEIVQGNFGIAGVDRPMSWAPLSPAYARKVGREIATLFVTGNLKAAVKVIGGEGDSCVVSVSDADVPYATVHQNGSTRMPKRPYFPIDDNGQVMEWTNGQVVEAAQKSLEEELK